MDYIAKLIRDARAKGHFKRCGLCGYEWWTTDWGLHLHKLTCIHKTEEERRIYSMTGQWPEEEE